MILPFQQHLAIRRIDMQLDFSELTPQAQALLNNLQPGEEIIITNEEKPAFKLTPVNGHVNCDADDQAPKRKRRQVGLSNTIIWISPDFDEPLEDFAEYMP
jgi:antitoxin (DNA-binding transcriptional repressor) of toxin-antitoxin stability system